MEADQEKSNDFTDYYGSIDKDPPGEETFSMKANKVILSILWTVIRCIVIVFVGFLIIQGGRKAYAFGEAVFLDEPMTSEENAREITVTIPDNASAKEIGEILERKNLIRDALVFFAQSLCVEEGDEMKGGRYELNTAMTAGEMMEVIAAGESEE